MLTTFTGNARCTDKQHINIANLKIPVHTIDELDEIEEDNDKISVIVSFMLVYFYSIIIVFFPN